MNQVLVEPAARPKAIDATGDCPSPHSGRRIDSFLAELEQMTAQERISASRYSFDRWERSVYAGRYPTEAPTINGELEWIAATLV